MYTNRSCFARTGFACGIMALGFILAATQTASADYVGNKYAWINNASQQLLTNFPRVEGFLWFQQNKERDWRVNSDPYSLTAFQNSWGTLEQGVYLQDFPTDTTAIDDYETLVGTQQTRVGWYESLDTPFPTQSVTQVLARGSTPYIVWEPFDGSVAGESARSGESRLDDIVNGFYDDQIEAWANAIKDVALVTGNKTIEISFGHEGNGDWFTWGYLNDHNGNNVDSYINAFRHVVDVFEYKDVECVEWVWTINASWTDDFSAAFPGKDYVDIMAMNGFNWGGDPNGTIADYLKWREFEEIFGYWDPYNPTGVNNYDALCALADDLPILIGEFGTDGGAPEPATLALLGIGAFTALRRARRR